MWDGANWSSLTDYDIDYFGNTYSDYYPELLTCWSIHLTPRGTLYAAMQMTGTGQEPVSGVYRLRNISDPSPTWEWVGDGQDAGFYDSVEYIGLTGKSLIYLTVHDGAALDPEDPDILYLGSRTGSYGLFRCEQEFPLGSPLASWTEIAYSKWTQWGFELYDGSNSQFDAGWLKNSAAVLFHPAVFPGSPDRIAVQFAGAMHVSSDGGDTWEQRYSISDGIGWKTRGYNEMTMEDLEIDDSGRLYLSAGDEGLFRSVDNGWKFGDGAFENINPSINSTNPGEHEVWNHESGVVKIRPNWRNQGENAVFAIYGDIVQRQSPAKIMMRVGDGLWWDITYGVPNLNQYQFTDFDFVDEETIYATYLYYNNTVGSDDPKALFVSSGVMKLDFVGAGQPWSHSFVDTGLNDANSNNAFGAALIFNNYTRRLFLAGQYVNFSGDGYAVSPANTVIKGSLFYLDVDTSTTWQHAFSGSDLSNFIDVRCLAQSSSGETLYVGTRGRSSGIGTVLKLSTDLLTVDWLANEDSTSGSFGFVSPYNLGWDDLTANRTLTQVRTIAVDPSPANPDHLFIGLGARGCAAQEGAWELDGGNWYHLSSGESFEGMGIRSLLITPGASPFLVVGTDGQGASYKLLDAAPQYVPEISSAAEFPILAGNDDYSTSISVAVSHPLGYDLDVFVDASAQGGSINRGLDDGVYPDYKAGDGIFASQLDKISVGAGIEYVTVRATAEIGNGGDGSFAVNDSVAVEAIASAVKMSEASGFTGDLDTLLTGNPYAENYFATELAGDEENLLIVAKDNVDEAPQIFQRGPVARAGAPDFVEKTSQYFDTAPSVGSRCVIAAEVDTDPGKELFVCNNGTSPKFFLNDETAGSFIDATSTFFDAQGLAAIQYSHTAAWGDYNGDGWIDLVVASLGSSHSGYTMTQLDADPSAFSTISLFKGYPDHFELTSHSVFPTDMTVLSMSWRDMNNDRKEDLVLFSFNQHDTNPVVMINEGRDEGIGDFTLIQSTDWGNAAPVRNFAWTDFDHDDGNTQDLVALTNHEPNILAVLRVDPTGGYVNTYSDVLDTIYETVLVGDILQNGQQDIVVFPSKGGPVKYPLTYFSGGASPTLENLAPTYGLKTSNLAAGSYASGGVVADFNDDHDLDVLVGWPASQPFFYRNVRSNFDSAADYDATGQFNNDLPIVGEQNWVQVDLTSLGNVNRSCIGAKVVVTEDSGDQRKWLQVVDGGSGRGGQEANQLHFGLGSYSGTVSVVVFWPLPGPFLTSVTGKQVNQVIEIPELADKVGGCIVINIRSVQFSHQPFPGGSDWIFEWKTDVKGDLTKDQVTWRYQAGLPVPSECLRTAPGTLQWGDPDVEVSAYYRNGSWQHRLIWKNQFCSTEPCPFEFEATSGYDGCSVTSGTVLFGNFGVCIGQ